MMLILFAFIVVVFPTVNSYQVPSYPTKCESGERYILSTNECEYPHCPYDHPYGYPSIWKPYPNCTCIPEDYIFNIYFHRCATLCPQNSTGSWPNCICDGNGNSNGQEEVYKYYQVTNTCQKLECNGNMIGTYPNCMCIDEYFRYNIDDHVCVQVCNFTNDSSDDDYDCVHVCPKNSTADWPYCNCGIGIEYDEYSDSCKTIECPDEDSIGIYPNCTCADEKLTYNIDRNRCVHVCPEDTTGYWPYCKCGIGKEYDEDSESCKDNKCPDEDSTGIYPNCTCTHKTFDYNIEFNRCFRVCPKDSSGYWPNCICDDVGSSFNKKSFECLTCPSDSTGTYPNCKCGTGISYIKHCNICEKCGENSVFYNGSCECTDGYIYDIYENKCVAESIFVPLNEDETENLQCPLNTHGVFPNNCFCENNVTYDYISQSCKSCNEHEQFSLTLGKCVRCSGSDIFNPTYGVCVPEKLQCPLGSIGLHPHCTCENGKYDNDLRSCDHCRGNYSRKLDECLICTNGYYDGRSEECILCPANSTGIHPKCKCGTADQIYNVYSKTCVERCDDFSFNVDSRCGYGHYFDDNDSLCKSNVGRKCPINSIGDGPDCLCIQKNYIFIDHIWDCKDLYKPPPPPPPPPSPPTRPDSTLAPVDALLLALLVG